MIPAVSGQQPSSGSPNNFRGGERNAAAVLPAGQENAARQLHQFEFFLGVRLLPANQEIAFESRHALFPAGIISMSALL